MSRSRLTGRATGCCCSVFSIFMPRRQHVPWQPGRGQVFRGKRKQHLFLSLSFSHADTHTHTDTHRSINADGLLEDKSKTQRSFHTHAVLNKAGFESDKDKQQYVCHLLVLKLLLSVSLQCRDNTKNKLQH